MAGQPTQGLLSGGDWYDGMNWCEGQSACKVGRSEGGQVCEEPAASSCQMKSLLTEGTACTQRWKLANALKGLVHQAGSQESQTQNDLWDQAVVEISEACKTR